jgi:hypothetical protein
MFVLGIRELPQLIRPITGEELQVKFFWGAEEKFLKY